MMDMRVKTERNNWRKKWDQGGKMTTGSGEK